MQVVDSLEPRVLLTDGIPGIPSTAQSAFTDVNQFVQGSIAANVDARFQQYLEKAGLNSPTELADQLRDVNYKFQQIAGNTPSGTELPSTEFGSGLNTFFQSQVNLFGGQIESIVPNMNEASPRMLATLPTSFAPGTIVSFPSFPGMTYTYSSPTFVWGSTGTATVPTPGATASVSLQSMLEYNNPSLPAGAIDRYRQKVEWSDSTMSAGTLKYEVSKEKSSADGLSSLFYQMTVTHHEFSPTSVEAIFRQRDGAWIRDVSFQTTGDVVSRVNAKLQYVQDGTDITVSYQDMPGLPADRRRSWSGFASREDEVLGNPVKFIGKTQHFEDGDRSAWFAGGAEYENSWLIASAGIQELDGESQSIASVAYYLKRNFWILDGIGVTASFSGENGWTGATPQYLNYFVPKDKLSLFLNVQQLGDSMQSTLDIPVFSY